MPNAESAPESGGESVECSRKGCRAPAKWVLVWNNPKIHTPDRRKTWVACDDHRGYLTQFLDARGFLRETVAFSEFNG
ncbi:hypothetical protein ACFO4E_29200 [Nocardiopsis mangrovi]|uniref:Acetone carboxylase n=1 Tax=Nocardiopsis mangrovi TaxID=1179818 RepID=A0ABV9E425_9ACTN